MQRCDHCGIEIAGDAECAFTVLRIVAPASAPQAVRMLTEDELLSTFFAVKPQIGEHHRLTFESGPYSISKASLPLLMLAEAIQRKFCEVNGIVPLSPHGSLAFAAPKRSPMSDTPAAAAITAEDGENLAVRCFLMQYGLGLTVEAMKLHMRRCGYPLWPVWVEWETARGHLTKAGAQRWLRHLFALEGAPVAAQPAASGVDAVWVEKAKWLSTIAINAQSEYTVAAEWKSPFTSDLRLKAGAAISELDAHLSTALGGKSNG